MKIIPTTFKEKIPKGFSYPIGTELLSRALEDVPQFGLFTLLFWYRDEYWASSYTQKIKEKSPIKIIEVSFKSYRPNLSSSKSMIESGYYEPKWEIRINSIPSEYAGIVKEQLITKVLPQLASLLKKDFEKPSQQVLNLVVIFHPKLKEITLSF
jgi:hypothetical protein